MVGGGGGMKGVLGLRLSMIVFVFRLFFLCGAPSSSLVVTSIRLLNSAIETLTLILISDTLINKRADRKYLCNIMGLFTASLP